MNASRSSLPRGGAAHFLEVAMTTAYDGQRKMLLCIDDSQAMLNYERRILERSGYIVVTEPSARRGLRLATIFRFDAVLLDCPMPEIGGHQVAHEMRRPRPDP